MEDECRRIVQRLKTLKLNFLALDFDMTVIDIHTGGRWSGSACELSEQIRPFFRALIPAAIAEGLQVAIVTFSPQVAMIADVLAYAFGQETALKIPIRGNDSSWEYSGGGSREGKQGHISSACEEVTQNLQQMAAAASSVNPAACGETRRSTTLLIDDDGDNVAHALENQVRAVLFKPAQPEAVIEELFGLE